MLAGSRGDYDKAALRIIAQYERVLRAQRRSAAYSAATERCHILLVLEVYASW